MSVKLFHGVVIVGLSHGVVGEKVYNSYTPLRLQSDGTDQCSSSDKSIWQDSVPASNQFYDNIQTCTYQNAGSSNLTAAVQECMLIAYPSLSQSCADCFASDVDCGATNCRGVCQDETSSSCQTCLSPCTTTLAQCAGTSDLPTNAATSTTTKSSMHTFGGTVVMFVLMLITAV